MSGLHLAISLLAVMALLAMGIWGLRLFLRPSSWLLCGALFITAFLLLFDIGSFAQTSDAAVRWCQWTLYAEGLMVPVWLLCSLTFARKPGLVYLRGPMIRLGLALSLLLALVPLLFPVDTFFYSPDFPRERILFLTSFGFYFHVGIMSFLVLALIQFETTFTNASPQALWNAKYHLVGLALILCVQVFYYSQALLYRTINLEYGQLRSLMFLVAALLMLYASLRRDTDIKITISRQMALKSVVLFAVGAYLVLLGLLGEGLRYCSGEFSRSVGISLAFLLGAGLLLLLVSDRVRREIKVVLHKHFYQNKYDYRTQWLLLTERLSSPHWEELQQSILETYCSTFGVHGAGLFLYDEHRCLYTVTATYRLALKNEVLQPDNGLVRFMQERGWVFFSRDRLVEVLEENRRLFDDLQATFVVPLPGNGRLEGFIVLGPMVKPDETYIYEDFDLMKTYARQAVQAIRQHRLSRALLQSREEAAIGNVATFVMHDLKNQVAALSLITENAPGLITNPEFQRDLVFSLQTTVQKMQALIGNLKTLDRQKLLDLSTVDLLDLVQECAEQFGNGTVAVSGDRVFATMDRGEIQKVVMNLLLNGIEASPQGALVQAWVGSGEDGVFVRVADSGSGMTPQFIQTELFVPFRSTKPSGLGIGLFQCRQIVQGHGGRIDVESTPGRGSVFTVWLPGRQER